MGGKTKQTQRTKNNAKPSNSGRSAELLGASAPAFVGFTAHTSFGGLVPFAPGFATTDSLPDTFDSSMSSEMQIILRKLTKKDPVTKNKALAEFNAIVAESDIEVIKSLLPLWPKFYQNLANDIDHRVRENTQQAQSILASKSGKNIAPYLRQLGPVWIASQYDNYPPAASVAIASFKAAFPPLKVQEVCLFCQNEILDFVIKNLTFHTAQTLSSSVQCTPEEAEHKYQRVVIASLKTYAFYLEQTESKGCGDIEEKALGLLANQKFWSFAKHRVAVIKSAWFELMYAILQFAPKQLDATKTQLIQVVFQNLDERDPSTLPHVWGCILLVQRVFDDWYENVNFVKTIQPKLVALLKSGLNGNATALCPNLLPFISKLFTENVTSLALNELLNDILHALKTSIIATFESPINKSDCAAMVTAFYECIRYALQKWTISDNQGRVSLEIGESYLRSYIIEIIEVTLRTDGIAIRYIYNNLSSLIAYWSENSESKVYSKLLHAFWIQLFEIITILFSSNENIELVVEHVVELTVALYVASPTLHDQKVKFFTEGTDLEKRRKSADSHRHLSAYVKTDLKNLAIQLTQLGVDYLSSGNYITHIRELTEMFGDVEFYSNISKDKDLKTTLHIFTKTLKGEQRPSEAAIEISFEIINLLEYDDRTEEISKLLQIKNKIVQEWILQRLLSHPLYKEAYVRDLLAQDRAVSIITRIAEDALLNNVSNDRLNLLHKCFFQTDSGDILISQTGVSGIMENMLKPLIGHDDDLDHMIDTCGSFIAQIMPVICSEQNASDKMKYDTFITLYKFSIDMVENDYLSEDTLWEITSCWQDALSSGDITLKADLLLECSNILGNRLNHSDSLTIDELTNISDMVSKLIMCSTESSETEDERLKAIDNMLDVLFKTNDEGHSDSLGQMCALIESILGLTSVSYLRNNSIGSIEIRNLFRKSLVVLSTILKMTCNVQNQVKVKLDDEEYTEDYFDPSENLLQNWSEKLYTYILETMKVAAIGESLLTNSSMVNEDLEYVILNLSEKLNLLLKNCGSTNVDEIKKQLLAGAARNDLDFGRALPYLLQTETYLDFEDSALVVFMEEISDYMLEKKSYQAYINLVQFLMPKITPRSLPCRPELFTSDVELFIQIAETRNLIRNHFSGDINEITDRKIIVQALQLVTAVTESHSSPKETLLYSKDVSKEDFSKVALVIEYVNLLSELLERFPGEFNMKTWDVVRIGLSSWVLSMWESISATNNPKTVLFTAAVYKLNSNLCKFITREKNKSSTAKMSAIIDEWENLFAREVNLVLFKSFRILLKQSDVSPSSHTTLIDVVSPCIESLDYSIIFGSYQTSLKTGTSDLVDFLLENITSPVHSIRSVAMFILKKIAHFFVVVDAEMLEKKNEILERNTNAANTVAEDWHFLSKFAATLERFDSAVSIYIEEFSYKLTELVDLQPMDRENALNYMFLWDYIIFLCSNAPVELRSLYASWISEHKFEQNFLNFLFRAMPVEILKNHDSKLMSTDLFKGLTWEQIKDSNLQLEKYACHLYSEMLRRLPAIVRKWWNSSHSRQKTFVDKLTTNFVSSIICQEELRAISNKKEKHENMQVTVHTSTREVMACYSIDEARMELVITLAQNHPLGGVKVEIGKQIGGKASSRNVGMQLTIFLTHQNGSIFDGLSLWKKNLDKKFEGVEECYVCYTVIHQDTCQLPKLSCRTCRKKFHGPCLYKWFTTSSKSTCPICRNVF